MAQRELRARIFGVVRAHAAWSAAGALALACGGQLEDGSTGSGGAAGRAGSGSGGTTGSGGAQGSTGGSASVGGSSGSPSAGGTAGSGALPGVGGTGAVAGVGGTAGSVSSGGTAGSVSTGGTGGTVVVDAGVDGGGPAMVCAAVGTLPSDDSGFYGLFTQCYSPTELQQYVQVSLPAPIGSACSLGVMCPTVGALGFTGCDSFQGGPVAGVAAGSTELTCCYTMSCDCCGRPFRVDGSARVAALEDASLDWCGVVPALGASGPVPASDDRGALTEESAAELARAWLDDALSEHASVASFARAALALQRLGAPAELVAASLAAGLDETEHARLCFALARRYGGAPVGPGALALGGVASPASLAELAVDLLIEACVGETVAAAVAAEQRAVAVDPEARAALTRIADDEAAHAELGWRTLAWALSVGGAPVRRAVEDAARRVLGPGDCVAAITPPAADAARNHHGRLSAAQRATVEELTRRTLVEPCLAALLAVDVTAADRYTEGVSATPRFAAHQGLA